VDKTFGEAVSKGSRLHFHCDFNVKRPSPASAKLAGLTACFQAACVVTAAMACQYGHEKDMDA
jgi:hypothetical protein